MPRIELPRPRAFFCGRLPERRLERFLAGLYIFSSAAFLVGSIFFLPEFAGEPPEFSPEYEAGCWLYQLGSVGFMTVSAFDFEEARRIRDRINLMRGGANATEAAEADTSGLVRQRSGAMGLGSSRQRPVTPPDWKAPPKPDPRWIRARRLVSASTDQRAARRGGAGNRQQRPRLRASSANAGD